MVFTGGQIVAKSLVRNKVPWVAGIPGHGCLGLVDAFRKEQGNLPVYLVRHEQSAVHMADGYYRVTGDPAAVFTSIGPGALNLAVGLGTAYVDSTAMLSFIGETHSYMFGKGVLQEIERKGAADSLKVLEPLTKYSACVTRADQLPHALTRAFMAMKTGRPGPAVLALTMDAQSEGGPAGLKEEALAFPSPPVPDSQLISRAAALLDAARRPVILAGGGVLRSRAYQELIHLAERLGAAVITTMAGKSCFPENHLLYGWHAGSKGTDCGNDLARSADVLLAVGCRFADETTSSYRQGISFDIPRTRLIHADIDPAEIGKNYDVEIGIVGEARAVLQGLVDELGTAKERYLDKAYTQEIIEKRTQWLASLQSFRADHFSPVTISRALTEIRSALPADAFVVTSSGHSQAQVLQEFPFYVPGTLVTTGGFSTMGFSLPAALGVKLAFPGRHVMPIVGDADFLMTVQELAVAAQYGIDVKIVVFNNRGFLSIRDLQKDVYGEELSYAVEFNGLKGEPEAPDFVALARSFGVNARKVSQPGEVGQAVSKMLSEEGPSLLEVEVNREYPWSGGKATGWWDVPVPLYLEERRSSYEQARAEEDLSR